MNQPALQALPRRSSREQLHICILDDKSRLAEILRETPACTGITFSETSDPRQALRLIVNGKCRIALCNIEIVAMNGWAFLEQARQCGPGACVILTNGHDSIESAMEAIKHGAYDYLPKPVNRARIKQMLKDLPELPPRPVEQEVPAESWRPLPLDQVRQEHILRVLDLCRGNRMRTARMLGIGRTSLYRYLKRDGLNNRGTRASAGRP